MEKVDQTAVEPELLDLKRLCKLLNLHRAAVINLQDTGLIPLVKVPGLKGRKRFSRRADALAFVANMDDNRPKDCVTTG